MSEIIKSLASDGSINPPEGRSEQQPNPGELFLISPNRARELADLRIVHQDFFIAMGEQIDQYTQQQITDSILLTGQTNAEIARIWPEIANLAERAEMAFIESGMTIQGKPTLCESLVLITNRGDLASIYSDPKFAQIADRLNGFYDDITNTCAVNLYSILGAHEKASDYIASAASWGKLTDQDVGEKTSALNQFVRLKVIRTMIEERAHLMSLSLDQEKRIERRGIETIIFDESGHATHRDTALNEFVTDYFVNCIMKNSSLRFDFQDEIQDEFIGQESLSLRVAKRIAKIVGDKTLYTAYFGGDIGALRDSLNNPARRTKLTRDPNRFSEVSKVAKEAYAAKIAGDPKTETAKLQKIFSLL